MTTPDISAQIHAHPRYKTGLRPPSDKPTLKASRFLRASVLPQVPATVDHLAGVEFAMDKNDQFGTCGPCSLDNLARLVSQLLTGTRRDATWADIVALYKRQNPDFDERTGAGDGGVDMKTMLADAVKYGFGSTKVLGFAELDVTNDAELRAAVAVFGGVLLGLDLDIAQQTQMDQSPVVWDYVRSADWGGHAVLEGAYEANGEDIITWQERARMTSTFMTRQRVEAYVVILEDHETSPKFMQGWDSAAYAQAYQQITGRPYPGKIPSPTPTPSPTPAPSPVPSSPTADDVLAAAVKPWLAASHTWESRKAKDAAAALQTWMKATGRA